MKEKIDEMVSITAASMPGVYALEYESGGSGTEFSDAALEKFVSIILAKAAIYLQRKTGADTYQQLMNHFGLNHD